MPQLEAPDGGAVAHVPSVAPLAMLHEPVQQSPFATHASPACAQNEDAWQVPPEQRPEQQDALEVQALPTVEQEVLRGVHVPLLPQVWLQHWPDAVHG
jgi:hypothetical protein